MDGILSSALQVFLETLVRLLLPVLLTAAVGYFVQQWKLVSARIPAEQLAFASELVRQLVLAAEQSGLSGAIENEAKAKKEWVLQRAEAELASRGIKLDLHQISTLVEAAVLESLNFEKYQTEKLTSL